MARQIINGKKYDTSTATELGSRSGGGYCNDFRHWSESLYRTPNGKFFICGEGGPMSHWAVYSDNGNERSGSEGIRALTEAEALAWLEAADDKYVDVIEANFQIEAA